MKKAIQIYSSMSKQDVKRKVEDALIEAGVFEEGGDWPQKEVTLIVEVIDNA